MRERERERERQTKSECDVKQKKVINGDCFGGLEDVECERE